MKPLIRLSTLCIWLLLLVRFSLIPVLQPAPMLRSAARPRARQWRTARRIAGRLVLIRVQLVVLPIGGAV